MYLWGIMKILKKLLLCVMILLMLSGCGNAKQFTAYTIYPVGYLLDRICGDKIQKISIQNGSMVQVAKIKEDYEEQLQLEAMRNNRQNIRSEFNTAATELDDYATDYIRQCVTDPMDQSVKSVEDNISELRSTRADRSEMCQKLEKIQKEVQILISWIHDIA